MESWVRQCLDSHNAARAGLPPLTLDPALQDMARAHAQVMAIQKQLFHAQVPTSGLQNCLRGRKNFVEKPWVVVQKWVDDPPHRAILMNPRTTSIGVCYDLSSDGDVFVCANYR